MLLIKIRFSCISWRKENLKLCMYSGRFSIGAHILSANLVLLCLKSFGLLLFINPESRDGWLDQSRTDVHRFLVLVLVFAWVWVLVSEGNKFSWQHKGHLKKSDLPGEAANSWTKNKGGDGKLKRGEGADRHTNKETDTRTLLLIDCKGQWKYVLQLPPFKPWNHSSGSTFLLNLKINTDQRHLN